MFGLILPGQRIQTQINQIDASHFIFEINTVHLNFFSVFLLDLAFPENYGASVHFQWHGRTDWTYLGLLSNDKQSAIFKIGGTKADNIDGEDIMDDSVLTARLGLSIEPLEGILEQSRQLQFSKKSSQISLASKSKQIAPLQMVSRIVENLYNYCVSFSKALPSDGFSVFPQANVAGLFIPIKAIQEWYSSALKRLGSDPSMFNDTQMD